MRLTIEWLRTLVLAAGVLLVVALGVFLVVAKYRRQFNVRELPKKLGIDIQQEANGVTYSHALGSHSQFKIHASKVVELKNNHAMLHDVKIELYGADGSRLDRIEGDEFEYDQENNTATAAGPVEITMMRPGVAPDVAPKAIPGKILNDKKPIAKPLASAAEAAEKGQIHIKTSGLTFDYKSGVTTTNARVDFQMTQGEGSSMGATYDSQKGVMILDHAVELTARRGASPVQIHAQHAEFDRDDLLCRMHAATADYRGGQATAAEAKILFRQDGSAVRLDATNGFTLATATGGHVAAPTGSMDFDEHNQPRNAHLEGGVKMDSAKGTRQIHGNSPTAELEFTTQGQLRHAHLERGVEMTSEDRTMTAATARSGPEPMRVIRTWRAPVTDVEFRNVKRGQVEPVTIHGNGGVVITGESQRGKTAPVPSKLVADEMNGEFGPDSALTAITGVGHAGIEETTATGSRQTASGDRLQAHFAAGPEKTDAPKVGLGGAAQIEQAVLDGHVVLTQTPAAKPAAPAPAEMRATAGKAVYEGAGEWLHLTVNPRVEDGAIELTADKIDVSQESGDALARGNVKATWQDASNKGQASGKNGRAAGQDSMALGGQGPAHAVAQQAELKRANNQAVFTGHARLWQQANSIEGPVIVLDRDHKSLVSRSTSAAEPVRVVLLSAGALDATQAPGAKASGVSGAKSSTPSVIRVHGGQLDYSDVERKAVMVDGGLGPVVAETGTATSVSDRVELFLVPSGTHPGKDAPQGQVERMTASGHVVLSAPGRRGTGEQLTYTGRNGEYVLTGTPAAPPRMTDAARGNVTGEALIFDSRDDSVSIEGGGHETRTETTVRQGEGRSETQR